VRRGAAASAAALSLALTACGSSSLSDRQLRADATRVCTVTRTRLNRIAVPSSPAAGVRFLRRGMAVLAPEIKGLRALSPPSALGSTYSRALDALTSELADIEVADTRLVHGGDPVQIFQTLASRTAPLEAQANGAWTQLQIPACVER
jgi:hypothetical protein